MVLEAFQEEMSSQLNFEGRAGFTEVKKREEGQREVSKAKHRSVYRDSLCWI